jgi:GrpB-like predicted nucleotidyltransferase (UPF0157 family)
VAASQGLEVTCEAEGVRRIANLGLKANLNLLVAYDPLWPAAFEDETVRLAKALGPVAKGIEHYGSTAVPGLCAKPILDIMIGISPLSEWERCKPALEALDYDYAEGAGVAGHYIFGRGRDRTERTHLVHVVEYRGESWRGSLAFRDALRCYPVYANRMRRKKSARRPPLPETGPLITCKRVPSSPNPSRSFRRTAQREPTPSRTSPPQKPGLHDRRNRILCGAKEDHQLAESH